MLAGGTGGGAPPGAPDGQEVATASGVLNRISLAAAAAAPVQVRDDQFVYTRYTMESNPPAGKGRKVVGTGESWVSVDGSRPGWHIGPDKLGNATSDPTAAIADPSFEAPTYRFLTTLPTDPDALLARVRAHVADKADLKPNAVPDPDQAAFELLGHLNSSLLPPEFGAALYRAAAKIPGVVVVDDAVDAAGRHGIGVMRESARSGRSLTWIFDRESYEYLGSRSEDTRTGQVTNSLAVMSRAVVDEVRQTP